MIETRLNIAFSEDGNVTADLEVNAGDEIKLQAELVSFAHYAASVIVCLGRERAQPLLQTLIAGFDGSELPVKKLSPEGLHLVARFLDARRGPRLFFALKPRDLRRLGDDSDLLAHRSVLAVGKALTRNEDALALVNAVAAFVAGAARGGELRAGTEFDVSLAAADLAWRTAVQWPGMVPGFSTAELRCPTCLSEQLEFRLWPSKHSALRFCRRCETGVWFRAGSRPRSISSELSDAPYGLRDRLRAAANGTRSNPERPSGEFEAGDALTELKTLFHENGWSFSDVLGAPVLVSELSGDLGRWKFYAQVVEDQDLILFYSVCPLRVPEQRRPEVCEFLTRVNYGLAAGNFELDFSDGEVRYKTALQLRVHALDAATLRRVVRANGLAMETYLPGIGAVITGASARTAFERRTNDH
jgi:hypothetical protein